MISSQAGFSNILYSIWIIVIAVGGAFLFGLGESAWAASRFHLAHQGEWGYDFNQRMLRIKGETRWQGRLSYYFSFDRRRLVFAFLIGVATIIVSFALHLRIHYLLMIIVLLTALSLDLIRHGAQEAYENYRRKSGAEFWKIFFTHSNTKLGFRTFAPILVAFVLYLSSRLAAE